MIPLHHSSPPIIPTHNLHQPYHPHHHYFHFLMVIPPSLFTHIIAHQSTSLPSLLIIIPHPASPPMTPQSAVSSPSLNLITFRHYHSLLHITTHHHHHPNHNHHSITAHHTSSSSPQLPSPTYHHNSTKSVSSPSPPPPHNHII